MSEPAFAMFFWATFWLTKKFMTACSSSVLGSDIAVFWPLMPPLGGRSTSFALYCARDVTASCWL